MQEGSQARALDRFRPRRLPRQERSRTVFRKIISTAKLLFERQGYRHVTTNRIAEAANISIGSLYQYFANCESIALAVYEDACSEAVLVMKRRAIDIMSLSIEESVPEHIEWTFRILESNRYALLQLINEVPELRGVSRPVSFENLIHHVNQMFLEQHFTHVDRAILERKSYVLEKSVVGIISRYLEEKPDGLSRKDVIAEITELVQRYLAALNHHEIAAGPASVVA